MGDGKAIMSQMNQALDGRQYFTQKIPQMTALSEKISSNVDTIKAQVNDDTAPAGYYRALRDVAAWMPDNAILSAEGAGTMDIGLTQLPVSNARSCLNAGTYGTMELVLVMQLQHVLFTQTGRLFFLGLGYISSLGWRWRH